MTRDRSRNHRPGAERMASVLRWTERGLIAVGVVCLFAWASACAQRSLYQAEEESRFEQDIRLALSHETEPDQSEWSEQRVAAYRERRDTAFETLGRLTIPAAGVSVMVLDGTDDTVLDRAVGRIPGTAGVHEDGNLGIAGHRDGYFRGLRHLGPGDEMRLATVDGVARYEVTNLRIVEPEDVEVLDPTPTSVLTLVTCYPFYFVGSAPQRFVVQGRRIAFEPWTNETAATYLRPETATP